MQKYLMPFFMCLVSACASSPKSEYNSEGFIPASDCYGILESGTAISLYTKQDLTKLESETSTKIGGTIQIGGRAYQQILIQIGNVTMARTNRPSPNATSPDVIHSLSSIKGMIQLSGQAQNIQLACENHYRWPAPKASGSLAKI